MKKPYAKGYAINGVHHARSCTCTPCQARRGREKADRIVDLLEVKPMAKLGADVFVRAHFRKQKNHLRRQPVAQENYHQLLKRYGFLET